MHHIIDFGLFMPVILPENVVMVVHLRSQMITAGLMCMAGMGLEL